MDNHESELSEIEYFKVLCDDMSAVQDPPVISVIVDESF
jgi:hypothetical protein